MAKKIGILTGGGDCPGLNCAIKRIVHEAHEEFELEGIIQGWEGPIQMALSPSENIIDAYTMPLNPDEVRRIDRTGGTILMSSRANPFNHNGNDISDKVVEFLNDRYDAVIAIGGEDTLGAAGEMAKKGLRIVGIPKTIDKDLCGTEYTLGFDSAVDIVKKDVGRLRSTAGSHGMVYFVEIMGRRAGHLTYWGGRSSHANFITIPEVETDYQQLFELIESRRKSMPIKRGFNKDGRRYTIVLVSEGTVLRGVGEIRKGKEDPHGNVYLGGVADYLCVKYVETTGNENTRSLTLGHLQRSGPPSTKDGIMAEALAVKCLELVSKGQFGYMASIQGSSITSSPLDDVIGRIRVLDAQKCYNTKTFQPIISSTKIYNEIEISK